MIQTVNPLNWYRINAIASLPSSRSLGLLLACPGELVLFLRMIEITAHWKGMGRSQSRDSSPPWTRLLPAADITQCGHNRLLMMYRACLAKQADWHLGQGQVRSDVFISCEAFATFTILMSMHVLDLRSPEPRAYRTRTRFYRTVLV